jgi:4-hydroxythreonine-4-phosphate dehydrogenase
MNKPAIGITLGDYNGIGPEVILKSLNHNILLKWCTPIVYGSLKVLNFYKKQYDMRDFHFQVINDPDKARDEHANVINCWDDQATQVEPGKETKEAGAAAFACLERACKDLDAGKIAALVTAPINKNNIQSEQFNFPGHTEYLTEKFEAKESLMMMVSEGFRIGLATGHVPVQEVSNHLNSTLLKSKIELFLKSLKEDFSINKPKLAVLGLNPHAGESGLLGKEEQEIIQPVIEEYRNAGHLVFGPYPADGFFGKAQFKDFDGVLGMYHDQALIPFKYIAFDSGVNFTAGLPVIRTSPDHGTAYDIAGQNQADAGSFLQAFYLALELVKNRMNA